MTDKEKDALRIAAAAAVTLIALAAAILRLTVRERDNDIEAAEAFAVSGRAGENGYARHNDTFYELFEQ